MSPSRKCKYYIMWHTEPLDLVEVSLSIMARKEFIFTVSKTVSLLFEKIERREVKSSMY